MTEHVLVWHPKVPAKPRRGVRRPVAPDRHAHRPGAPGPPGTRGRPDDAGCACRARPERVAALRGHAESAGAPADAHRASTDLDEADKATVADILGEGDVWAKVGSDDAY